MFTTCYSMKEINFLKDHLFSSVRYCGTAGYTSKGRNLVFEKKKNCFDTLNCQMLCKQSKFRFSVNIISKLSKDMHDKYSWIVQYFSEN